MNLNIILHQVKIIIAIITLCLCLIACGKFESSYSNEEKTEMGNEIKPTEEKQMEENNRNIISEVLKFNKNSRKIQDITAALNTINAGYVQSAEIVEEDIDLILKIATQDGTNYQVYLSNSGFLEAIQNLDTGEWPITSEE